MIRGTKSLLNYVDLIPMIISFVNVYEHLLLLQINKFFHRQIINNIKCWDMKIIIYNINWSNFFKKSNLKINTLFKIADNRIKAISLKNGSVYIIKINLAT